MRPNLPATRLSKQRRKRSPGLSESNDDDIISQLPDFIISQILSFLTTKDVVKTSPLSKRWRNLWLSIPGLDLDSSQFPNHNAFVTFVDRFLELVREENSSLNKFKVSIEKDENDPPCISRWLEFVVRRGKKLQHLDVEVDTLLDKAYLEVMPLSLYVCETLVYLRLQQVKLLGFTSVSLPRLKTMSLENNVYGSDESVEMLISSCLVLEDLSIVTRIDHDNLKVLRVRSQTLTSLSVDFDFGEFGEALAMIDRKNSMLSIDAPRLEYLYLNDEVSESKIIYNSGSLAKVNLDGYFDVKYHPDGAGLSMNQMARNFFTAISRVKDMIISTQTMKFLHQYLYVEPLPQFYNLTSLEAEFDSTDVRILPTLLQSCPNLKSIVMDLTESAYWVAPSYSSSVPQCLLSSLEYVEIKSIFKVKYVDYHVAKYFIENSRVLKKLVVHLRCSMQEHQFFLLRTLLGLSRPSAGCQIVYVVDD